MTDKIISRREDGVGHIIFNNPERRNAVSLEMWQAVERVLEAFAATTTCAWWCSRAPAARRSSRAPTSRSSRTSARAPRRSRTTTRPPRGSTSKLDAFRSRPSRRSGLLRRRRRGARGVLRPAHLRRGLAIRHPGGEARPRLRLRRAEAPGDVIGPAFAKEMFFTARLFSAAEAYEMGLVNRVVADDRGRGLRRRLRPHDHRQRAAHRRRGQGGDRRGAEGPGRARPRAVRGAGAGLLRQPRLRRRPSGVPREAHARVHRGLRAAQPARCARVAALPQSSGGPGPGTRAGSP